MRIRPISLWRKAVFRWHAREREGLGFLAMAAVPVVALVSIVAFARSGKSGDDAARVDVARARAHEIRCLAENIYYEARGESQRVSYTTPQTVFG